MDGKIETNGCARVAARFWQFACFPRKSRRKYFGFFQTRSAGNGGIVRESPFVRCDFCYAVWPERALARVLRHRKPGRKAKRREGK